MRDAARGRESWSASPAVATALRRGGQRNSFGGVRTASTF
jgi:hypothetical protein